MGLLEIFWRVILPILVTMGVGIAADRAFRLDMRTLSKLNFYVFVPALIFKLIFDSEIQAGQFAAIVVFAVVHPLVLWAISWAAFAGPELREARPLLTLSVMFFNAGNYGIPLVMLAFEPSAASALAVVLVTQNLLNFTVGVYILNGADGGFARSTWRFVTTPPVVAIALGFVFRSMQLEQVPPVYEPIRRLADGLIPVALLTLGVQLARSRLGGATLPLTVATALRLVVSPALAALLVWLMGFPHDIAKVLIVSAGFPVAVNVYVLATEFDRKPALASQLVFASTVFSALTVPVLLWLVGR